MNKLMVGLITGGIIAGVGYGLALPATAASSHEQTISFVSHPVSDKIFHLGKSSAFGVGLVELLAGNDMQGHAKIGHDDIVEIVTRLSNGTADEMVNGTFTLRGGQIDVNGTATSTASGPGVFDLAITGGTGAYASAVGYARVVPTNLPRITLHISG